MHLADQAGAPHEKANIHTALARLSALRHDPTAQDHHLRQALNLYRQLGAPQADHIAEQLTRLSPAAEPDHPSTQEPK